MITKAEKNKYTIGGVSRDIQELPAFKPGEGEFGYAIYDGTIDTKESSVRFFIEAGHSSRPMVLTDDNYAGIRAVSSGEGYFLMLLTDKQLVCLPVSEGDNVSVAIGFHCTDCMIAKKGGPGLEVVEFGGPPFTPSMEKLAEPNNSEIPQEFFQIKDFLESGEEKKVFTILEKYKLQNHGH